MKNRIEQYFTNDLDATEKVEFLRAVVSDDELKTEFARYQNTQALCSLADEVVDITDSRRGYSQLLSRYKKRKTYHLIRKYVGYAAASILLIVSVHLYHVYTYLSTASEKAETSLFVPAGQRVNLTLPDGTVVWLNAQSRLIYPTIFAENERRVSIEGEAYFEVVPDKTKPFIVSIGDIEVKVLGTSFNVYNYPKETYCRVSLVEGSLQVYHPQNQLDGIVLKPNEEVRIEHGKMQVSVIPNADYFLWTEGICSFDNEDLDIILKKLELYYDIDIEVKDTDMLLWKYTVKFRQRDGIDEIFRLMQKVHPFHMQKDGENNKIIISK